MSKDSRYGLISSGVNSETFNAPIKSIGTTKLSFISWTVRLVNDSMVLSVLVAKSSFCLIMSRSNRTKFTITIGSLSCKISPSVNVYESPPASTKVSCVTLKVATLTVSENDRVTVSLVRSKSNPLNSGLFSSG